MITTFAKLVRSKVEGNEALELDNLYNVKVGFFFFCTLPFLLANAFASLVYTKRGFKNSLKMVVNNPHPFAQSWPHKSNIFKIKCLKLYYHFNCQKLAQKTSYQ
jgi:hypothetical protein